MKKSLISILALLLMVSCQDNVLAPEYMSGADDLYASIESVNATKTVMDENNNILWSEGDQLVAFMKTTLGVKYQIKEQFVGTSTGGFSKIDEQGNDDDLEAGQELDHNIVVYPHSYDVWCMKNDKNTPAESYKLNVIIPETQVYKENSFGIGAFPMIAVAMDNKLTFRNICGGLKLQFKGVDKIKSIRLEGLGNEKISGKSTVVGYVNGSTPVITMANSDQSYTHVILNCGEGVQLSETTPTTFIIAVPPVEFASGMKITVTDTDGFSKTLTNSSANTIKRSCLTRFPVITYKQDGIFELPEGTLTSHEIPAEGGRVEISLTTNQEYEVVIPEDAQEWISVAETKALRNETIVLNIVENNTSESRLAEILIANTEGVTLQAITISQGPGTVLPSYIDEYGVDHGPGTKIGETIWAPVNCGFHIIDYPYGKLYQWGRKHGQGYDDTDAEHPSGDNIALGPVSNEIGQAEINSGIFYRSSSSPYDWASTRNDIFWNSGSETSPIKTDFDPCPSGWRVPSHAELSELCQNKSSWTTNTLNQNGLCFSGSTTYSDDVPQIFLPAAGSRGYDDGIGYQRGSGGRYWSCDPNSNNAYDLNFGILYNQSTYAQIGKHSRANGYSVRCVQE